MDQCNRDPQKRNNCFQLLFHFHIKEYESKKRVNRRVNRMIEGYQTKALCVGYKKCKTIFPNQNKGDGQKSLCYTISANTCIIMRSNFSSFFSNFVKVDYKVWMTSCSIHQGVEQISLSYMEIGSKTESEYLLNFRSID